MEIKLEEIKPIQIKIVRSDEEEKKWNNLVSKYHYLGHKKVVGSRIKYLVYSRGEIISALCWKSGYIKVEVRDKYIGWNTKDRIQNLKYVINNNRFLILNWIKVKNLASYLLGRNMKQVKKE